QLCVRCPGLDGSLGTGQGAKTKSKNQAKHLPTALYTTSTMSAEEAANDANKANEGEAVEQNKRSPSDFLKDVLGRPVNVRLNSGTDYRGVLACLDGYMNIAMEQTEEYVDGQLKSKYGDCFIRGNNVLYISSQKR
ncbi:U6 snRNA-associated Sm-like protein LSm6, partial [Skeletonema marinoi]